MLAKKMITFLVAMSATIGCIADENYSSVNLGPTFFTFKGQNAQATAPSSDQGIYCGVRGELEYSKPQSIYLGLIGVYAPGASTSTHSLFHPTTKELLSLMQVSSYLYQLEGRIGKHYVEGTKFSFVPYFGIGMYHVDSAINMIGSQGSVQGSVKMDWYYGVVGAAANFQASEILDIGAEVKLLRHFYTKNEVTVNSQPVSSSEEAAWGFEVALPIKIRTGASGKWSLQPEPFFLKINLGQEVNVYGGRLVVHKAY